MGLTNFVKMPEVREKFTSLHPDPKKRPRRLRLPLQVPLRSQDSALVGTAFDYLLRFELQRRAPHAIASGWTAEDAPTHVYSVMQETPGTDSLTESSALASQVCRALNDAKAAVAHYLTLKSPTETERSELAIHAVQLARLERLCWISEFRFDFEQTIPPELIQELLELLDIVPYAQLLDDQVMLLGPTFEQVSAWFYGAKADLITGDMLVDIKTTGKDTIRSAYLNQILGYYLLARWQRRMDPGFPVIRRLGIYFARFGQLWSLETSEWTEHPMFPAVEEWFFQYARESFETQMMERTLEMLKTRERPLLPAQSQSLPVKEVTSKASSKAFSLVSPRQAQPSEASAVGEPRVECNQQSVTSSTGGVVMKVWRWLCQLFTSFYRLLRSCNRSRTWEHRSSSYAPTAEGKTPLLGDNQGGKEAQSS
jgi:hypothetical protein